MSAFRTARAALVLGACLVVLAWNAVVPGPADARGRSVREPGRRGGLQGSQERPGAGRAGAAGSQDRGSAESMDGRMPRRGQATLDRPGQLTPEKIERWRRMSPEERERIRERYRRWKALPPERRERVLEWRRRWRELPESERRYLMERREMYRNAWPQEQRVIEKFYVRWRQLPPDVRRTLRVKIAEWRELPAAERDERMTEWPFYSRLRPDEQRVIRWYLFSEPPAPRPPRE